MINNRSSAIRFFTPLQYSNSSTFLTIAEGYFHLFQKVATVKVDATDSKKLEVTELKKQPQPVYMIALKIASYCTLVIPLIMLITKAIIRSQYTIVKAQTSASAPTSVPEPTPMSEPTPMPAPTPAQMSVPVPLSPNSKLLLLSQPLNRPEFGQITSFNDYIKKLPLPKQPTTQPLNSYDSFLSVLYGDKTFDEIPAHHYHCFKKNEWLSLIINDKITFSDYINKCDNDNRVRKLSLCDYLLLIINSKITYDQIPKEDLSVNIYDYEYVLYGVIPFKEIKKPHWGPSQWANLVEYQIISLKEIPEERWDHSLIMSIIQTKNCNKNILEELGSKNIQPNHIIEIHKCGLIKKFEDLPQSIQNIFNKFSNKDKKEVETQFK